MEVPPHISVFETPEQLAEAAAERFVKVANHAQESSGRFSVALAGGRTPKRVYELLATEGFRNRVEWSRVYVFFGDERCVPLDHAQSNYAMAHSALLSKVPLPAGNVFRIAGEGDPTEGARAYEAELSQFFAPVARLRFDLVLLGMGADGHTASLFPESNALEETFQLVVPTKSPQEQCRITLTLGALNTAARTIFLVTGEEKAATLSKVLQRQSGSLRLPASLIKPNDGTLEWFVDRKAASGLQQFT
ncbi:MAG TPA: 6-phosphogluconolactonase [Pyrinomonadaceae bacterium]|nr:6-phosphogluconolactonase [Pyrinomonadaceae bacterium]